MTTVTEFAKEFPVTGLKTVIYEGRPHLGFCVFRTRDQAVAWEAETIVEGINLNDAGAIMSHCTTDNPIAWHDATLKRVK